MVCFTSDHNATLSSLPASRMRTVIDAWADRTAALSAQPGVEQVFCFENRGVEIGVTLAHPHGQIYGYPFVTPKTAAAIRSVRGLPGSDRRQPVRRPAGRRIGRRLADRRQNEHWVAFVPFAARWPVEVHLYPRRQVRDLTALDDDERAALAELYLEVIRRMEGVFDDTLPAITGVHQAPVHADRRRLPAASGGVHHPSRRRQAEVPGRIGISNGSLRQRHHPGDRRAARLRDVSNRVAR